MQVFNRRGNIYGLAKLFETIHEYTSRVTRFSKARGRLTCGLSKVHIVCVLCILNNRSHEKVASSINVIKTMKPVVGRTLKMKPKYKREK